MRLPYYAGEFLLHQWDMLALLYGGQCDDTRRAVIFVHYDGERSNIIISNEVHQALSLLSINMSSLPTSRTFRLPIRSSKSTHAVS